MITLTADDIFSLIVLIIATYIFIKAFRYNWNRWQFYNHCEVTKAQLVPESFSTVNRDASLMDERTLRYVNSFGKMVTFKTRWLPKGEKGQEFYSDGVEIIYDPDNPDDVKLNNFLGTWFVPLVTLIVTLVIFILVLGDTLDEGVFQELGNTYHNILAFSQPRFS